MSIPVREIENFPFRRENAEALKTLGKKAVESQAELISFMKSIGSENTPEKVHLLFEMNTVELELALDGILESAFPELTPVEWGFSK